MISPSSREIRGRGSQVSKQRGNLAGDVLIDGVHPDQGIEYKQRRPAYLQRGFKPVLMIRTIQTESICGDDV